jgi:formylglycine-generating enzyme required for sulfatase activity
MTGTLTAAAFGALLFNTIVSRSAERGLDFLIERAAEGVDAVRSRRAFDRAFASAVSAFRDRRGKEAEAQRLLKILTDEKNQDALEPLALEARKLYLFPLTDRPDPWALVRTVRDVPAFATLLRGEDTLAGYFGELFGALHNHLLQENEFFGPVMRVCEQLRIGREVEAETRAARLANERAAALLQALLDFWCQERARQEAIPDLAPLRQEYFAFLHRQYARFDANSFLPRGLFPVMIELRDVFVDLQLQPLDADAGRRLVTGGRQTGLERGTKRSAPSPDRAFQEDVAAMRADPLSLRQALGERRLVVLGEPGAGKTTLLKRIALDFADRQGMTLYGLPDGLLPILFSIGDLARDRRECPGARPTLADFLPFYFRQWGQLRHDLGPLFKDALNAGYALVLMDGLDEVLNAAERRDVSKLISAFVAEYAQVPGNRFVVTSRPAGYDYPLSDGFRCVEAMPFERPDIERFVEQWCPAYQRALPEGAPQRRDPPEVNAGRLTQAIFEREDVTDLARNPLLITLLSLVYYEGRKLPERRVDLYKRCIEALIDKWNLVRSLGGAAVGAGGELTWRLTFKDAVSFLGPVALWIRRENPDALTVPQDRLVDLFIETLHHKLGYSRGEAERLAQHDLLVSLRDASGLLQHRGGEQFGFLHPTFLEYLAARGLLNLGRQREPTVKNIAPDPAWREVLRLAVAGTDEDSVQEELLQAILDASAEERHLGRNVVLAGECLLDAGRAPLWDEVRRRLLETMRDPAVPVQTRAEAGTVLGRLGDLRPDVASRLPVLVEVPAGPFWMGDDQSQWDDEKPAHAWDLPTYWIGRYPVTNAQFGAFIEAGGYDDDSLWTPEGLAWRKSAEKRWDRTHSDRPEYWDRYGQSRPNHPVVGVTWYEAVAYCNWLGHEFQALENKGIRDQGIRKSGVPDSLIPSFPDSLFTFRLPTEAEWEKAAKGGISLPGPNPNPRPKRSYPWGEQFDRLRANTYDGGAGTTTPVGMYPADGQPYEIYDLAGNVWEWCSSAYVSYKESPGGGPAEPDARPEDRRVVRGGSWAPRPGYARCAYRSHLDPDNFRDGLGFRVVGLLTLQGS